MYGQQFFQLAVFLLKEINLNFFLKYKTRCVQKSRDRCKDKYIFYILL